MKRIFYILVIVKVPMKAEIVRNLVATKKLYVKMVEYATLLPTNVHAISDTLECFARTVKL